MTWMPFLVERKNIMKINTALTMSQFMKITQEIFEGYFDLEGNYSPAMGDLLTLNIFYDTCISEYELQADPNDLEAKLNELISSEAIMNEYDKSNIYANFDFGNAVSNAKEMIQSKLEHPTSKIDEFIDKLIDIVGIFETKFSGIDANKITDALKSLDLNNLNTQAIVDAYSETERFKGNTSSILEAKNERIRRLQTENVNLRNKLSQKEAQKESVKNVLS